MKRLLATLFATASVATFANTVTVKPSNSNLSNLDHYTPVSWGFGLEGLDLGPRMEISKAVVRIHNIFNWNDSTNKLFIDLIDNPTSGVKFYGDEKAPKSETGTLSDYFMQGKIVGQGSYNVKEGQEVTKLTEFVDSTKGNKGELFEYSFNTDQLGKLTSYLASAPGNDVSWKTEKYTVTEEYQKWIPGHYEGAGNNRHWVRGHFETAEREVKKTRQVQVLTPQATVGLTFDADCHYYNCGVEFEVTTSKVPDTTTTLGLFGLALAGLLSLRRRK
ncbi:VPDSG-CTERM sorting domain-containing protein [Nibricoccus sp. IMCC34717]|uniref:VPDSG-CTERM sorting domain-containing protein n=1 Tax=Nibricoccus sp. IMCC34717 TaxID=3034021 RepID=UPI00384B654F